MKEHPVELLIRQADKAIVEEDFDTLMDIYSDDAILVIKPGLNATGKSKIRDAMERIAEYFEHTLRVEQAGMEVLDSGDTALVLAKTVVWAKNMEKTERKATYVFKKYDSSWRCVIDNSYGHELLE